LEGDEGNEGESESEDTNKLDSIPLWKYVTKLEGGRGGEPIKFMCKGGGKLLCKRDCHKGKPYSGSYTRVRRHLCGIMPGDKAQHRITGGIKVFSQISNEERAKYIKEEEAAGRKFIKNKSFNLMPHQNVWPFPNLPHLVPLMLVGPRARMWGVEVEQ
jgi:hypothetical protein